MTDSSDHATHVMLGDFSPALDAGAFGNVLLEKIDCHAGFLEYGR